MAVTTTSTTISFGNIQLPCEAVRHPHARCRLRDANEEQLLSNHEQLLLLGFRHRVRRLRLLLPGSRPDRR